MSWILSRSVSSAASPLIRPSRPPLPKLIASPAHAGFVDGVLGALCQIGFDTRPFQPIDDHGEHGQRQQPPQPTRRIAPHDALRSPKLDKTCTRPHAQSPVAIHFQTAAFSAVPSRQSRLARRRRSKAVTTAARKAHALALPNPALQRRQVGRDRSRPAQPPHTTWRVRLQFDFLLASRHLLFFHYSQAAAAFQGATDSGGATSLGGKLLPIRSKILVQRWRCGHFRPTTPLARRSVSPN